MNLIGAPVIAIITGMIISLAAPKFTHHDMLCGGIKFTSKKILQWAVIILGFSLNLGTIAKVGGKSLPVIISTVAISLIVAFVLMKLLKIHPKTAQIFQGGNRELYKSRRDPAGDTNPGDPAICGRRIHLHSKETRRQTRMGTGNRL